MNHYYSDISLLYASNIFVHAEAPRLQNLCHRLASSTMAFNYDQRRYLWHNFSAQHGKTGQPRTHTHPGPPLFLKSTS